jgi:hypothetical protein
MKSFKFLLLIFVYFIQPTYSQITILSSDIGSTGDTARYSHAIQTPILAIKATGVDYIWDFSELTASSQAFKEYKDLNNLPTIYKIAFWGKASFASPQADQSTSGFNLTNSYKFIKKTSSIFKITGIGGELNGTPLPIIFNSPDIIYRFPLNYNNTDSSNSSWSASLPNTGYIEEILNRKDTVDGWGIIKTPYGEFNCLRIKSEVHKEDTIFLSSSGVGMRIPQNYTEYIWLAKNMKYPIMKATITHGFFEQSSIFYMDSIRTFVSTNSTYCPAPPLRVMPNPATDYLKIEINNLSKAKLEIIDIQGKILYSKETYSQEFINIQTSNWSKGLYFIKLIKEGDISIKKVIIQ